MSISRIHNLSPPMLWFQGAPDNPSPTDTPEKILFVLNPNARGGMAPEQLKEKILKTLSRLGLGDVAVMGFTTEIGEVLEERLNRDDKQLRRVVAVGGDGTVNRVITAAKGAGISIGIVPMGTGNTIATMLGLPLYGLNAFDKALKAALGESTRKINLGKVNGQICVAGISTGAIQEVLDAGNAHPGWKKLRTPGYFMAYFVEALKSNKLIHPGFYHRYQVEVDGKEFSITTLTLSILNGFDRHLFSYIKPDDGDLDLLTVPGGFWDIASKTKAVFQLLFKKPGDLKTRYGLIHEKGKTFHIQPLDAPELVYNVDGDTRTAKTLDISLDEDTVEIAVPEKSGSA